MVTKQLELPGILFPTFELETRPHIQGSLGGLAKAAYCLPVQDRTHTILGSISSLYRRSQAVYLSMRVKRNRSLVAPDFRFCRRW